MNYKKYVKQMEIKFHKSCNFMQNFTTLINFLYNLFLSFHLYTHFYFMLYHL